MGERALIVIDVQNDYFSGGAWALPNSEQTLPNIVGLIAGARQRGDRLVFIQHVTPAGSPVFAEGSLGGQLHEGLGVQPNDLVIPKSHPSAFQETTLQSVLEKEGIQSLDICGFMTQMCCDTTAREGYRTGYKVRLFSDGCAAKELEVEGEKLPHDVVHRVSLGALARFAQILKTGEA